MNNRLNITILSSIAFLISFLAPANAAPSLVDSISAVQLEGIKVNAISSVFAENGTLWITDQSNQVFQWELGKKPSSVIKGGKQKTFTSVVPIGKGRAVVTDGGNHHFLIGTDSGWESFAEEGDLEGQLDEPIAAVWSNDGMLYIAEAGNQRISVFTDKGLFLFSFGNNAEDEDENLETILSLAIDRLGRIYVLDDYKGGRISIYSPLGELDTILGKDELLAITPDPAKIIALAVRPDGVLLAADKKTGRIYEIDWENMELISSFATAGKGRGQLRKVSSLSVDSDGRLYVADSGNSKIEVFQLDWSRASWLRADANRLSIYPSSVLKSACNISYIYTSDSMLCINTKKDRVTLRRFDGSLQQTLETKFDEPIKAVFDKNEILVLDLAGVHVFDSQGNFKFSFSSKGKRDGELSHALALTISPHAVYVADTGNSRVQVFSRNGLFQRTLGNRKDDQIRLDEPAAIAVDKRGFIYVADTELNKVIAYTAKGDFKKEIGEKEGHPLAFLHLFDIMVDNRDTLYVAASIKNNPISVWMYQQGKLSYRFSPFSSQAQTGIDQQWAHPFASKTNDLNTLQTQAYQSLNKITELKIDPENELFSSKGGFFGSGDDNWLFNAIASNPDAFSIVDLKAQARHTFTILRAPKQVESIAIGGNEEVFNMSWLSPYPNFTGYYKIYGRDDISAPFMLLNQTVPNHFKQNRLKLKSSEYRISAVSPYGKESKLSPIAQDSFWLGLKAFQSNRFDASTSFFEQAVQNNPKHAAAWLYLGKAQLKTKRFDAAVSTFKQLATFTDYKQKGLHLQAESLMQKQAWLDVKSLVDDTETNGSVDAKLYSLAAQALIEMDDIPSAIYYLDQAVRLEPTSATWHLKLADANFELGAADNAKLELIRASQLAGQSIQAWLSVSRTYKKHKLFSQSISSYGSALLVSPQNEQALSELAILHLEQGNLDKARALSTQMAGIPSLKGTSYYILGRIALAEDKAPQALAMLAKAGQIEPNNASIWLAMADAYAKINKPNREQEYLKKAAATDGSNFNVHMRLAKSCEVKHDTPCMLTHYKMAVDIDSKNVGAQIGYAKSLMESGKMNEADKVAHIAIKLDPNFIPSYLILADVQSAKGMIRDGINTLKKALVIDDTNIDVHLSLAKAYIGNHMYDDALTITEKAMLLDIRNAAPLVLMGNIYLARQTFDKAIESLEKAVALAPDNAKYRQQLNMAYLQKKRSVDAGGNLLGPKLKQLNYNRVFSSAYKQYTDVPVGNLILKNEAGIDYSNVKISLFIKEYMDFPTTTVVERIAAGGEIKVPLLAAFNNRILSIDEDTGVQTEVRAEYYMAGKPHTETLNASLTIFGKNAIVWDKLDMVGSFATPKDDTLATFTRQLVNTYQPQKGAVNANIAKAMTVFNGLSAYGIKYLLDPNTPYDHLTAAQLDTVQFPRETLRQRSGDCDDLSILLASSLANLGIETAILDVPQHLMMMFNTGIPEDQRDLISSNDGALAIINEEVWIPVEATLIASSFTEAWAEGARKYHLYGKQGKLKIMPLAIAWQTYPPVTLPPADFSVTIPSKEALGAKIEKEWEILSVKSLERQVRPYRMMLSLDPKNTQAKMQIAIVYAQSGLYERASNELKSILAIDKENMAAINNLGNIYYLQHKYKEALDMYNRALEIEPSADIMVNISMVNYKLGNAIQAKSMFEQAIEADDQVPMRYQGLALLLKQ